MDPRAGGSSSTSDSSQLLLEVIQERDTLAAEAQRLRAETARLLEVEAQLLGELAVARRGDNKVQVAETAVTCLQEELATAWEQAYAMSRELATERATVIRLQAEIIHLERRRSRSSASASDRPSESAVETRLRRLEKQLIECSRSRSQSQQSRHSVSQASAVGIRAMMPPPTSISVPPPDDPAPSDTAHIEEAGTSAPTGTQEGDTPDC